jgi:hypothetical protein
MKYYVKFQNFGKRAHGTVVTSSATMTGESVIVYARNPYGLHNLVLIDNGVAVRHGNDAVIAWARAFGIREKQIRRAISFLAMRK